MDAQVLLLMDPGAELGWAELSDTLPSAGRERESTLVTTTKIISQKEFTDISCSKSRVSKWVRVQTVVILSFLSGLYRPEINHVGKRHYFLTVS